MSEKVQNWYESQLVLIVRKLDELTQEAILPILQDAIKQLEQPVTDSTGSPRKSDHYLERVREKFQKVLQSDILDPDVIESQIIHSVAPEKQSIYEKVIAAVNKVVDMFQSPVLVEQYERIAKAAVDMASVDSDEQYRKIISNAFGIDISQVYPDDRKYENVETEEDEEGNTTSLSWQHATIDELIAKNVALIKTIPSTYFEAIENNVREAFFSGQTRSTAKEFSEVYDPDKQKMVERKTLASDIKKMVSEKSFSKESTRDFIATRIARDQMGKIYSDLTRSNQSRSGIKLFKWLTSEDQRVSGNPNGHYPDAKVSCYDISRKKTKHGEGIYEVSHGADWGGKKGLFPGKAHIQCRCVMIPLMEGVNYDSETKEYKKYGV